MPPLGRWRTYPSNNPVHRRRHAPSLPQGQSRLAGSKEIVMKMRVLLLISAFLPLAAPAALADPAYLTVSGEGSVSAAPDAVTINAGVVSQGKTAKEALDAN